MPGTKCLHEMSDKVLALAGKHIEAKRWTLVESSDQEDDRVEEMINA